MFCHVPTLSSLFACLFFIQAGLASHNNVWYLSLLTLEKAINTEHPVHVQAVFL